MAISRATPRVLAIHRLLAVRVSMVARGFGLVLLLEAGLLACAVDPAMKIPHPNIKPFVVQSDENLGFDEDRRMKLALGLQLSSIEDSKGKELTNKLGSDLKQRFQVGYENAYSPYFVIANEDPDLLLRFTTIRINREFSAISLSYDVFVEYRVEIIDRRGTLVKQSNGRIPWDDSFDWRPEPWLSELRMRKTIEKLYEKISPDMFSTPLR